LNLLLRDYLWTHADSVREYARVKRTLAERFRDDREGYVRAKEPTVWSLLRRAHEWAEESGWDPAPSDI
ncbi:MAG: GrpB family protein, partial [Thermoplasmata archaeon]